MFVEDGFLYCTLLMRQRQNRDGFVRQHVPRPIWFLPSQPRSKVNTLLFSETIEASSKTRKRRSRSSSALSGLTMFQSVAKSRAGLKTFERGPNITLKITWSNSGRRLSCLQGCSTCWNKKHQSNLYSDLIIMSSDTIRRSGISLSSQCCNGHVIIRCGLAVRWGCGWVDIPTISCDSQSPAYLIVKGFHSRSLLPFLYQWTMNKSKKHERVRARWGAGLHKLIHGIGHHIISFHCPRKNNPYAAYRSSKHSKNILGNLTMLQKWLHQPSTWYKMWQTAAGYRKSGLNNACASSHTWFHGTYYMEILLCCHAFASYASL